MRQWPFYVFAVCMAYLIASSIYNRISINSNTAHISDIEELQQKMLATQTDVTKNRLRILENEPRIESATKDRWHKADHDKWAEELKRLNPHLTLPK